jgi:hypothetical protein
MLVADCKVGPTALYHVLTFVSETLAVSVLVEVQVAQKTTRLPLVVLELGVTLQEVVPPLHCALLWTCEIVANAGLARASNKQKSRPFIGPSLGCISAVNES